MFIEACIIFCFRNLWYHHYSTCVQDLSAGGASWGCHIASGGYSAWQTVPWYCWWVEVNSVIYCKPTFLHMIEIFTTIASFSLAGISVKVTYQFWWTSMHKKNSDWFLEFVVRTYLHFINLQNKLSLTKFIFSL